jgi:hypothetical protein
LLIISRMAPKISADEPATGLVPTTFPAGIVDEFTKNWDWLGCGSDTAENPAVKSFALASVTVRPETSGITTVPPRLIEIVTKVPNGTDAPAG